jgi:hypothetical protein
MEDKMKKILIIMAVVISSVSFAKSHGPAGCGLGSIVLEGKEGLVFNVLAATLNGTSANQTFGMSTGTLGCEDAKTAKVSAVSFIEGNKVALTNDIARGNGETLEAYLSVVGKTNANKETLKNNFSSIFAENNAVSIDAKINSLI